MEWPFVDICFDFSWADRYLGVELLGHRVNLGFKFKELLNYFPNLPVPFYILTSIVMRTPVSPHSYQCLLLSIFLIIIWVDVKWHFIMVIICISLMTNAVEHLFMCLLAIHLSSLPKCLYKSIEFFVFKSRYEVDTTSSFPLAPREEDSFENESKFLRLVSGRLGFPGD